MSARKAMLALALAVSSVVACGGRSDAPTANEGTEASTEAGSATSSAAADGGESLPPGVAYVVGGVSCCAKGIGRQCCEPGKPCGPYGGAIGQCLPAGSSISGKDLCTICCDGLGVIGRTKLVDGKCADDAFPDDGALCAACGDGLCHASAGENPCNCPADCGPPP